MIRILLLQSLELESLFSSSITSGAAAKGSLLSDPFLLFLTLVLGRLKFMREDLCFCYVAAAAARCELLMTDCLVLVLSRSIS